MDRAKEFTPSALAIKLCILHKYIYIAVYAPVQASVVASYHIQIPFKVRIHIYIVLPIM